MIFAHGNGELIDFWPQRLQEFTQFGLGVLLVEYPGYGRSEGRSRLKTPSPKCLSPAYDALAARKDVDPSRIVLLGRSLGGGAVCALAARRPTAALILLSTFTSVRSLAHGFLLPGFLVRDPFDNLNVVRLFDGPVLVAHGTEDRLVPYTHGQALHRAAKLGKLLTYTSGHNDCPPDWSVFRQGVVSFLQDAGILASTRSDPG